MKTQVLDEAGMNPIWNQTFNLTYKSAEDIINFTVMEHENKFDDVVIGKRSLKFEHLLNKEFVDKHFILKFEGKSVGTLRIKATELNQVDINKRKMILK